MDWMNDGLFFCVNVCLCAWVRNNGDMYLSPRRDHPAANFRPRFHWWGREARQDAHQVTKDYGTQSRGLL